MAAPRHSAPLRLEILLNGRRLAIAGVEQFGVLSAIVSWVRRNPDKVTPEMRKREGFDELHFLREICEFQLSGLDSVTDESVFWVKEELRPGSEVTIRVLPQGEFDAPRTKDDT